MAGLVEGQPPTDDEAPPLGHILGVCCLPECMVSRAPKMKLQKCGACKEVAYCCKEHQVLHFKSHKHLCKGRKDQTSDISFGVFERRAIDAEKKGDWKGALTAYGCMLELTEKGIDVFHTQCSNILDRMAKIRKKVNDLDTAICMYQRMIIIKDFNNPNNTDELNEDAFKTMGQLAEAYVMKGNLELAVEMLRKTDDAAKENFGEQSFQRGQTLTTLSNPLHQLKKTDEAIEVLRTAVSLEGFTGENVKDSSKKLIISNAYENLGILLDENGDRAASKAAYEVCLRLKLGAGLLTSHNDVTEVNAKIKALMC